MVQVQLNIKYIETEENRYSGQLELNNLRREDANPHEIELASHVEDLIRSLLMSVFKGEISEFQLIGDEAKERVFVSVWPFHHAPKQYQELSPHMGDEDWIAFVPEELKSTHFPWMDEGSPFGCCSVSEHEVDGGRIHIGAHA